MKKLLTKLFLLLSLACLTAILFDQAYRRATDGETEWAPVLMAHPPIEEKYQIVKVGNSHPQDGLTFKGYNVRGLDLTRGAQRFRYDLVMLKQYSRQIEEGAVILIDASHISFSHSDAKVVAGVQQGYYHSASPFFIPNLEVGEYLQTEILPFVRAGYLWRAEYAKKVTDRIAKEQKAPELRTVGIQGLTTEEPLPTKTNRLTLSPEEYYFNVEVINRELASPSATIPATYTDNINFIFNKWYHTDEFDPKYFEANQQDLEKLIAYCLKMNWQPVVITVPIAQVLEKGLLDDYAQVYLYDNLAQTDLQGVEYLDFTQRKDITRNFTFFGNADHLNPKGAAIFSYVVLQELIDKGYLPAEADGYDYRPLRSFDQAEEE